MINQTTILDFPPNPPHSTVIISRPKYRNKYITISLDFSVGAVLRF